MKEKIITFVKGFINKCKIIYSNEYVKSFIWIYLVGLLCFSIRAGFNHFTLPMGGDYTLQTYAFYSIRPPPLKGLYLS